MAHPAGKTYLENLVDPQVVGDMVNEKIEARLVLTPYVKVDTTLQGRPGSTVTVPVTKYIGDAVDVAEGAEIPLRELETDTAEYTIKKAGLAVFVTDEAVLSGLGDPIGNATNQLSKAIASKIDNDEVDALLSASTSYTAGSIIGYSAVVNAIDIFEEETQSEKILLVHPKQVTQLRLDPDFISADKYKGEVIAKGEIGTIAGARIVTTKKVPVSGNGANALYTNPVVQLSFDSETEVDTPALTIYKKRDTNTETDREILKKSTVIASDQIYAAVLTDETKVVLLKTLVTAPDNTDGETDG